jgi:(p)ppGpp synthase/HD superfamily hydrolase
MEIHFLLKNYMIESRIFMIGKLKEKIKEYYQDADLSTIDKAYSLALNAHKEQKRVSGEDYISHPISVAYILADLQLDIATITGRLLVRAQSEEPYFGPLAQLVRATGS